MTYTLYGSPGSGSACIEMALRAAELDYSVVRASEWEPDSAMPALRKVNPLGQIPTLVLPDGTIMTESAAILIYMGLEFPGHQLLSRHASERAMELRGLVFIAANCYPAVSVSDYPQRWTTATTAPAQARVCNAARIQLHRYWEVIADTFSAALEDSQAQPGALAFLAVVVSRWSGARQHLHTARPRFAKLLAVLETHPSIAEGLLP